LGKGLTTPRRKKKKTASYEISNMASDLAGSCEHGNELSYLLTPWCRLLFQKLIVTQLVKKIPLSYGTRRFTTVFTKARHWTLS
jgi:hypothetical protein